MRHSMETQTFNVTFRKGYLRWMGGKDFTRQKGLFDPFREWVLELFHFS